jgi:hypothetical protein
VMGSMRSPFWRIDPRSGGQIGRLRILSTWQIGGHMHTNDQTVSVARRRRRRYSREFKADVVAACQQPGISMASIALSRGLNANLLRRWFVEAEQTGSVSVSPRRARVESSSTFMPVPFVYGRPDFFSCGR